MSVKCGVVVRASDLQPMVTPLHVQNWASCSHTCASVHQAVKSIRVMKL